ncbi:MAG: VWA domain-containing protein [Flavobacteriales bacterium]|nr:VWA domain-containing protein [Flavobacteriales bacterium]
MDSITFLHPEFFWLFLLLPLPILWKFWNTQNKRNTLKISSLEGVKDVTSIMTRINPLLFGIRIIALSALIVALARPQTVETSSSSKKNRGIDIVMAIDVSASMLAKDLKPNRIEALKKVASNFVQDRVNDRIGIVVYAAESYTRTPITSDKNIVQDAIRSIEYNNVLQDGTGIGMGLATSINRLKESTAKSRIIILLTDGVNNSGFLEPDAAAELAKEYGIKVYTIGIGTNGFADFPYAIDQQGNFLFKTMPVEIDEELMKSIAKTTSGKYFRATDNEKLRAIYDEINQLETTEIKEKKYFRYNEKYRPFVLLAGLLFMIEILLKQTLFKSFI